MTWFLYFSIFMAGALVSLIAMALLVASGDTAEEGRRQQWEHDRQACWRCRQPLQGTDHASPRL